MPSFFVLFADSAEQAERVYGVFKKNHGYLVPADASRLFQISFRYHGRILKVAVGKQIDGFPEPVGPVLGIIESQSLVTIHTQLRGGLSATPILVSPDEVTERVFFDNVLVRF
jgi:hypothetical protein